MATDILRKARWFSLASLFALSTAASVGCGSEAAAVDEGFGDEGASTDAITRVDQTKVKRQSIGNCWIYATSSWLEALNKSATNVEQNTSESYLTYWHWFDQIANGAAGSELSTGGSWAIAAEIILRYGITLEKDFIAVEADDEMSARQKTALAAMNESLKNGALKDPTARRNRTLVRQELDKAWQLTPQVTARLNSVFGKSVSRTLDRSYSRTAPSPASKIIRASDFPAKIKDPTSGEMKKLTLADALGKKSDSFGARTGTYTWQEVTYPYDAHGRRQFQKRVQKALHDKQPVIISWKVDFNALTNAAVFSLDELNAKGPGHQGGHMTVLHDYEVTNVPGFGDLKAGTEETRADALQAALDENATISFFRVKNSWGSYRPDRWATAAIPGYTDLDIAYLNGPIKQCVELADGSTDATNCPSQVTPLWDVVLPKGY